MKKNSGRGNNMVDALGEEHQYAVLTKGRRIQILVQPTAKRLRKRGKRGWHLFGTVEQGVDVGQVLGDTVQKAVLEVEDGRRTPTNGGTKVGPSKASPKH